METVRRLVRSGMIFPAQVWRSQRFNQSSKFPFSLVVGFNSVRQSVTHGFVVGVQVVVVLDWV
nr:hypothetical protein [Symbiopectobacterium purcellii]